MMMTMTRIRCSLQHSRHSSLKEPGLVKIYHGLIWWLHQRLSWTWHCEGPCKLSSGRNQLRQHFQRSISSLSPPGWGLTFLEQCKSWQSTTDVMDYDT